MKEDSLSSFLHLKNKDQKYKCHQNLYSSQNQKFWFHIQSHAHLEEKHIHLGFVVQGKDCHRGGGSHSGAFLNNSLQAWGDHHASSSCTITVKIAIGPHIIQILNHFLPSSSNPPASIQWLQQSCLQCLS